MSRRYNVTRASQASRNTHWLGDAIAAISWSIPEEADWRGALAYDGIEHLRTLSDDVDVRRCIDTVLSRLSTNQQFEISQKRIVEFLVDATWICKHSQATQKEKHNSPSRSQTYSKLVSTSRKIDSLIHDLDSHSLELKDALNVKYLSDRHKAGNRTGHIYERKKPSGFIRTPSRNRDLPNILRALSSDILEEAALIGIRIQAKRQTTGSMAPYYSAIDMLSSAANRLLGRVETQLIAQVINTLMTPPDPVDADMIRKRRTAKASKEN